MQSQFAEKLEANITKTWALETNCQRRRCCYIC